MAVIAPASASAGFGLVAQWGTEGTGNGQFNNPLGIATDATGSVYVADTRNHRIQKFTNTGRFITKWGSPGYGPGQFWAPRGIATLGSSVYVGGNQSRIQKFDSNGAFLRMWGKGVQDGSPVFQVCTTGCTFSQPGSGNGELGSFVDGIATDADENVYAADQGNARVQKFTSSGTFVTKWGSIGTGNGQFGASGPGGPLYIATDAAGNVYTTDNDLKRIQKFTSSGTFLTAWGQQGTGNDEFTEPYGVATDPAGNVYVADAGNDRIQKFAPNGDFLAKWGSRGSAAGQFRGANGVATDRFGDIYVADNGNDRIQRFRELVITTALVGKPVLTRLFAKLGCPDLDCVLSVSGKAIVEIPNPGPRRDAAGVAKKEKTFKFKMKSVPLVAGERKKVRVKFRKNPRTTRKIKRLIKRRGAKAKATINVRGTKPFRDVNPTKLKIKKLKP